MIYEVGGSDSDDSVFKYFNPKGKKDGNTTKASVIQNLTKKSNQTLKTINSGSIKTNKPKPVVALPTPAAPVTSKPQSQKAGLKPNKSVAVVNS